MSKLNKPFIKPPHIISAAELARQSADLNLAKALAKKPKLVGNVGKTVKSVDLARNPKK